MIKGPDNEEERWAESDFCALLTAEKVKSDKARLKRAQAFEQKTIDQKGQDWDQIILRQMPFVVYPFRK